MNIEQLHFKLEQIDLGVALYIDYIELKKNKDDINCSHDSRIAKNNEKSSFLIN